MKLFYNSLCHCKSIKARTQEEDKNSLKYKTMEFTIFILMKHLKQISFLLPKEENCREIDLLLGLHDKRYFNRLQNKLKRIYNFIDKIFFYTLQAVIYFGKDQINFYYDMSLQAVNDFSSQTHKEKEIKKKMIFFTNTYFKYLENLDIL